MPQLLSLPDEALKLILTHVPLKDRLCSCCLVHTRLHAAAAAATQQLELGALCKPVALNRARSVLSWLSLYGQHVTHLVIRCPEDLTLAQLPCPNLVDLHIVWGSIQLGPTADGPGVIQGITKLTRLELRPTKVVDGPADCLTCLVHLRHLHVDAELSPATLPRLVHLTHLTHGSMSPENLLQLGGLTALQQLCCTGQPGVAVTASSVTGLVLPPGLTELALHTAWTAEPQARPGLETALLPLAPAGLRALHVGLRTGPAPPEALFTCLARLQCLTELELYGDRMALPPPGPVYSALTASSSLVSLRLGSSFPAGVWPFVFRAGHPLPHLTYLNLDCDDDGSYVPWVFGAANVAALISCCPGLREIHFLWLQHGPHVSKLRKLTALAKLHVRCDEGDPGGVIEGLAAVTQLQDLDAYVGSPTVDVTVASLLPLTSLSALTSLCCEWWEVDIEAMQAINIRTQAGLPPDVWLQLLDQCVTEDPDCQPTALRGLAQRLSAQAHQIAGLQAQLCRQEQRNAAAQQVAAEQGARITAQAGCSSCCSTSL